MSHLSLKCGEPKHKMIATSVSKKPSKATLIFMKGGPLRTFYILLPVRSRLHLYSYRTHTAGLYADKPMN